MRRISKTTFAILFSLLFAVVISFTAFTAPVSAEDREEAGMPEGPKTVYHKSSETPGLAEGSDGTGVHADPATFEKNFCLSVAQKEYAITEIERAVSRILKPGMSDLEKYYRLAVWENKRAKYDWKFWDGSYNFELYRHQWDSYGVLTEKSVCVGIAITYAILCHAADLPCKFVRTDPKKVDHTVNYIPDINGNAYCIDVTENTFLMSQYADNYSKIDKDFAHITEDCTDGSFEYHKKFNDGLYEAIIATNIKDCYGITYDDWFREYALHENPELDFQTPYEEKGSGVPVTDSRYRHASYHTYPSQFSETEPPACVWFLEDFYKDPEGARSKILNKELDEQFLNISGVEKSYDCKSIKEFEEIIKDDISVKYFPSSEDGEVIAWADDLKNKTDFTINYDSYDASKGEAVFAIKGIGAYKGTYQMRVKLNNIKNAKVVLSKNAFIYNAKVQKPAIKTIKGMTLKEGTDYTAIWSNAKSKNAGTYTVTIKGKGIFSGTTKATYKINKAANTLKVKVKTAAVKYGKLKKKTQTLGVANVIRFTNKGQGTKTYTEASGNKKITINKKTGKVTVKKGLKKGTYKVSIKVKAAGNKNYKASKVIKVTFSIKVK